jgi:hypothetical protein
MILTRISASTDADMFKVQTSKTTHISLQRRFVALEELLIVPTY